VLKVVTHDLGDAVEIRVRDNGTGIPPEIKDKLFQPFFTTKPKGRGSACRSAGTSSRSSTAARSRSTAGSASSPNARSACPAPGRPPLP
jgi:hypothetical protein